MFELSGMRTNLQFDEVYSKVEELRIAHTSPKESVIECRSRNADRCPDPRKRGS